VPLPLPTDGKAGLKMMHRSRRFAVGNLLATELADKLKESTWTLCTGFRCGRFLWLNDSTSEDAVQEYAVVRESDMFQVESITVSWCTKERLYGYAVAPGSVESFGKITNPIDKVDEHERCALCA